LNPFNSPFIIILPTLKGEENGIFPFMPRKMEDIVEKFG